MPLTPGDMPTRPEKAYPAIQHPQVILHTLRQLGTQHLRPELETRVRTGETEAWIEAAFTPQGSRSYPRDINRHHPH